MHNKTKKLQKNLKNQLVFFDISKKLIIFEKTKIESYEDTSKRLPEEIKEDGQDEHKRAGISF